MIHDDQTLTNVSQKPVFLLAKTKNFLSFQSLRTFSGFAEIRWRNENNFKYANLNLRYSGFIKLSLTLPNSLIPFIYKTPDKEHNQEKFTHKRKLQGIVCHLTHRNVKICNLACWRNLTEEPYVISLLHEFDTDVTSCTIRLQLDTSEMMFIKHFLSVLNKLNRNYLANMHLWFFENGSGGGHNNILDFPKTPFLRRFHILYMTVTHTQHHWHVHDIIDT